MRNKQFDQPEPPHETGPQAATLTESPAGTGRVRASLTPPIESPATARTGIPIARTGEPARPNVLICTVAGLYEPDTTAAPIGGTARGYQAVFASLAVAVLGARGPTGGRPGALPIRLIVAALA
jgi:hypothetical protein